MPQLQKLFTLDITPEKFLEACSGVELHEVNLLLNQERFQRRMQVDIVPCHLFAHGCPYHACMSNDCQRPGMLKRGDCKHLGPGHCDNILSV